MPLHAYRWLPRGTPRAVLVLVHGFCEHAGRYAALAARLNDAGIAVAAVDLRGHGRSPGPRISIRRFDDYVDDAAENYALARAEFAGLPLFLMGFSLGGVIAPWLVLERGVAVDGLVVGAAGAVISREVAPLLRRLAPLLSRLVPWLRLVKVNGYMLSPDPDVVAVFDQDPLCFHGRFPVRTGVEILAAVQQFPAMLPELRCPLLVLHGTGDRLTPVEGGQLIHRLAASPDKTLRLYPDMPHDLFRCPQHEQVTQDLLDWLQARIAAKAQ